MRNTLRKVGEKVKEKLWKEQDQLHKKDFRPKLRWHRKHQNVEIQIETPNYRYTMQSKKGVEELLEDYTKAIIFITGDIDDSLLQP